MSNHGPNIGQPPAKANLRDAIHVAVISQVAHKRLQSGAILEHGVVDPFGPIMVAKGELYWPFLKPGTAANLRHEWDHPAFERKVEDATESVEELKAKIEVLEKAASETDYEYGGCRGC